MPKRDTKMVICRIQSWYNKKNETNQINKLIEESMEKIREREKRLSVTLLALVVVFLICNSCFLAKRLLRLLQLSYGIIGQLPHELTGHVSRMLLTLNACVNSIVYCMSNVEFRRYYLSYLKKIGNLLTFNCFRN